MAASTPRGASDRSGQRLLDGENPGTGDLEESRHWRQVCTELVAFTEEALRLTREVGVGRADAANPDGDAQLGSRQLERMRARLEFWTQRFQQLAGRTGDPVT